MTQPEPPKKAKDKSSEEAKDKDLVNSLLLIKSHNFEVWKYFEERSKRLSEQLWVTGTWLMALLGTTLSIPFVAKFIKFEATISIQPIPVLLIAVVGITFCVFSYNAIQDIRDHIKRNWRRANYVLTGIWEQKQASMKGRKQHGWIVLLCFGICACIAFFLLLLLALVTLLE